MGTKRTFSGMRAALVALILTIPPLGAAAQWAPYDPAPPERHVHPYRGFLYVSRVAPDDVWRMCAQLFAKYPDLGGASSLHAPDQQLGCSAVDHSRFGARFSSCHVVVAKGDEQTFIHELAHCNGWPPSHPTD